MKEQTAFLQQFNDAFAKGDISYIAEQVTDDIVWDMMGEFKIKGKDAFKNSLQEMTGMETLDMQILNTIIDGKYASVNGTMKVKEPSGNIRFFGFVMFMNSTVKKTKSKK